MYDMYVPSTIKAVVEAFQTNYLYTSNYHSISMAHKCSKAYPVSTSTDRCPLCGNAMQNSPTQCIYLCIQNQVFTPAPPFDKSKRYS